MRDERVPAADSQRLLIQPRAVEKRREEVNRVRGDGGVVRVLLATPRGAVVVARREEREQHPNAAEAVDDVLRAVRRADPRRADDHRRDVRGIVFDEQVAVAAGRILVPAAADGVDGGGDSVLHRAEPRPRAAAFRADGGVARPPARGGGVEG